jgi:N-methylhydantoinase A
MIDMLGIDIGGTFTDFVLVRDGRIAIFKRLSSPDDPARALLDGVAAIGAPSLVVHGTTVATNALLERRGAATALITTTGFADVLEIGRGERRALYDLALRHMPPLVPRAWRLEIAGRRAADGSELEPIPAAALAALLEQLQALPIESLAICLLHSDTDPAHERTITHLLHHALPHLAISAAHAIAAEPREYERTSTTVVNAYLVPLLDRYIARLSTALGACGVDSLRIMGSDGGTMGPATARALPARATLSGPAGGLVAAHHLARRAGFRRIISLDMGGTSTDVAWCADDLPRSAASAVGGLPVSLPSLDIHTVGAGGGSLARIDAGGSLRVGPESAGADPGPACHGRGTRPTVTDANLLLGRLQPDDFLGGALRLDPARAAAAFAPLVVALGGAPDDAHALRRAALGVIRVADAAMERAIRQMTIERGEDPRDATLVAFGGAGPLHAAALAAALHIPRVLVPRHPGVLSALGMVLADVTRDAAVTILRLITRLDAAEVTWQIAQLAPPLRLALIADGVAEPAISFAAELDLRYQGQSYELATPLPLDAQLGIDESALQHAVARFHRLHEQRYGHRRDDDHPLELVTLRLRARAAQPDVPIAAHPPHSAQLPPPARIVHAVLDTAGGEPVAVPVYQRDTLGAGAQITGGAIVVQLDATTIIPAGWLAQVDAEHNLVLWRATTAPTPARHAPADAER